MKKLTCILMLAGMVILSMSACAQKDSSGLSVTFTSEIVVTETTLLAGSFVEADLVFLQDGQSFPLRSDVEALIAVLGDGYELTVAPSCAFEGEDKIFEYPNLTIYTNPLDGKDLIDEIYITGGEYTTPRGIGIGDTRDEVIAAYGEGFDQEGTLVYALRQDIELYRSPQLFIDFEDDIVLNISFYAASNVQ